MKTPLFETHVRLGAKMVPFAGWDMPVQYAGILAEHEATRTACAVFDTSHMGEFEVRGRSAKADLERLLTLPVSKLQDGQCRYGFLLREDGGVLDDLTCYRWADDHYWVIVNAGTLATDREWIRGHLSPDTTFRDLSPLTAKLDVQGPGSQAVLERAFGSWPELGYFRFALREAGGIPLVISRTGYTGEWGYELYFGASVAEEFWRRVTDAGAIPAGLGARDTLRTEMAYPLYGHELDESRTPVAFARGMFLDRSKDFIGKAACERDLNTGAGRYLAGLRLLTKRAARSGDRVFAGGREAGVVTSGSLSPSLGVAVAMAYLDDAQTAPGTSVEVEVHGKRLTAGVVSLPFYTRGTARRKNPPEVV